jgi:hypothetical protein
VRRIVAATIAAGALVLGACESDSGDDSVGSGGGYYDACRNYTSCSTCTPIEGCGWCFDSDGTGMCAASPDECVTPAFSWTWNPSGCRIPADAGIAPASDAGPASPPEQDAAGPGEIPPPVEDAVAPPAEPPLDAGGVAPEASAPDGNSGT